MMIKFRTERQKKLDEQKLKILEKIDKYQTIAYDKYKADMHKTRFVKNKKPNILGLESYLSDKQKASNRKLWDKYKEIQKKY